MNKEQEMVREFNRTFDLPFQEKPTCHVPSFIKRLKIKLIQEELIELEEAMFESCDLEGVADALGDLLYVVYGAADAYGIDMEPIFAEIHRSNMTKIGGHKNDYGKWVKPPTYEPPNLKPFLVG